MSLIQKGIFDSFCNKIQKETLPGIWSKGVALSRLQAVSFDRITADEIICRVIVKDRPVSPKVTLWPPDEDWFCDCGDRNELCAHIAAAAIALKAGPSLAANTTEDSENYNTNRPTLASVSPRLGYRLTRTEQGTQFTRVIVSGVGGDAKETVLRESLVSRIGGIQSGRILEKMISATQADFGVDRVLSSFTNPIFEASQWERLFPFLTECTDLLLDGQPITVSTQRTGIRAKLVQEGKGFRINGTMDPLISEILRPGLALCGSMLKLVQGIGLPAPLQSLLTPEGRFFSEREIPFLVTEVIPELRAKVSLEIATEALPEPIRLQPRVVLRLENLGSEILLVTPSLVYGDPIIAEVKSGQQSESSAALDLFQPGKVVLRDLPQERALSRKLLSELHLQLGQPGRYEGQEAVKFRMKLDDWETVGKGSETFGVRGELEPHFEFNTDGLKIIFKTQQGGQAQLGRVFEAWQDGTGFVPLFGGGFAPLPLDWLEKYGAKIQSLMQGRLLKDDLISLKKLPAFLLPELATICEELGQDYPESLKNLRKRLLHFEGIPETCLPSDLRASLRSYQRSGVDWLCFMRESQMGAMLADDMGLGKTLQALCAIRGRTLIVCPTSVLQSWKTQLQDFRPGLRFSIYHGSNRRIDRNHDVTLTTYALLRLDQGLLTTEAWDSVVLDEAQMIKNPESQVAQAAHQLKASFKIALSGTPVENRLEDLWSQFQFLNPGMLGTRREFQENYSNPISRGVRAVADRLQGKIKPFILRRMKKEVAPELPERTEVVLHCELNTNESEIYQALLASTRAQVLEKLETGGGVMAALELLLRLRQVCCHAKLVPGQKGESSSKLTLLMQTLTNSLELGHRALIFSQWTSYLDLIEPLLRAENIKFLRLDGSTSDRGDVVESFQREDGPPVLLLSLKAGGTGITLTRADQVFLMDPWWNPAVEDQAADRAHRIGQKNPVLIHRLVAKDTVEDKILLLQKKKTEMAKAVLSEGGAALSLTKDDLLELLQ